MVIARVALDVPLDRLFDYDARDARATDVGLRAEVPFGRRIAVGVIVEVTGTSELPASKLRSVQRILRDVPPLPADWREFLSSVARYYQHPLGEALAMALPPILRRAGPLPKKGLVETLPAEVDTRPAAMPVLLPEQKLAFEAVFGSFGRFQPFLLYGVTGSGKTEVYLRVIERTLATGAQALMLVPEIALTPQLVDRVRARFPGARLICLHSGLGEGVRATGFLDAMRGGADIVLGTRLAVFTPLPRLGVIVVDEEHDPSFKQQDGIRYSARDAAVLRAKQADVPVLLGSATPSLESYHHATNGRYRLIELPRRALAQRLPTVRCIDTRTEKLQDGFSQRLLCALEANLGRGEQSLIFLNRRGYAPVLACPACGWVSRCGHCSANLVVHLAERCLRCHHCGAQAALPASCPVCGNQDIHPFGRGTQRIEAMLTARFPAARVLRVDRDSASTARRSQGMLQRIHAGEVDILVGTQMLAKGHDFARLTLVGVLNADASLFAADFRAPERLFSQLLQVGGRSGRAELEGEVMIQTEYPAHPLYQALLDHDYRRFAEAQLAERKQAGFPPYMHQAMLRAEAKDLSQSLDFLNRAAEIGRELADQGLTVYDAVPMRLTRRADLERAQLLVESPRRPQLQAFLRAWMAKLRAQKAAKRVRWHIDVDPMEF